MRGRIACYFVIQFLVAGTILLASSWTTQAAPNSFCFRQFPEEVIACKDPVITALHVQELEIYAEALSSAKAKKRPGLIREQESWAENRATKCGIPIIEWVTAQEVRRVRPCLVASYQNRIAKLKDYIQTAKQQPPLVDAQRPPANAVDSAAPAVASPSGAAAPPDDDLKTRKQFWEEQAFYCKAQADIYPAKQDDPFDPMLRYNPAIPKKDWERNYISDVKCDDGDMTFFNSLLCAAEDQRGCKGAALAQDASGRWWRSKGLIGQIDTAGQASFSTEQGLGVLIYMIKTADKNRFQAWLKWIANNPHTYSVLPSYCPHKECVFKVIDCPLLVTIASRFELTSDALGVCDPLQILHVPRPDQIVQQVQRGLDKLLDATSRYENSLNQVINKLGGALGFPNVATILPTPIEQIKLQADLISRAVKEAFEKLIGPEIGEAAAQLAQEIALINAVVDGIDPNGFSLNVDTGKIVYKSGQVSVEGANVTVTGNLDYNPNGEHLASVEVFMLRNLGYHSDVLDKAAITAFTRDTNNPFFDYLVHGRSPEMLKLVLQKCPSRQSPSTTRLQWFPERGEDIQKDRNKTAWAESMYWDCIFLAHLYEAPTTAKLAGMGRPLDPFADLVNPMTNLRNFLASLQGPLADLEKKIKEMEDKLKPVFCRENPGNELCKVQPTKCLSLSQCAKDVFCQDNPNNTLCKVSSALCPCSGPLCPC